MIVSKKLKTQQKNKQEPFFNQSPANRWHTVYRTIRGTQLTTRASFCLR